MQNQNQNMSDLIESYLKNVLLSNEIVEIRRSEIADQFNCVPSQINYVINTRFTIQQGYVVESKRGGGGYIRIGKVEFSDRHQMICELFDRIGEQVSQQFFTDIVQLLFDERIMSEREGNLLLAISTDCVLGIDAPLIRARMLKKILQQLDRKGT